MSFWAGFLIGSLIVVLIVVFIKYFGTDIKNRISEVIKNRHKKCECVNLNDKSPENSHGKIVEKNAEKPPKEPFERPYEKLFSKS